MKVLIIDDDADIRFVAAMSLRAGGAIDVVEASGGLDGVCKAREEQPDVILLDMSGLAVRRSQIQSSEGTTGGRIVIARVPVAHLFGWASELNHRSKGRATYSMRFDSYQERDSSSGEGDRDSLVGAPIKPIVPNRESAIALPEPNEDDLEN